MVSKEFVKRILNKKVHVDYFDEKSGQVEWIEGIFSHYDYDNEEGDTTKSFIVIESETDFNRICEADIKKIYLKE